MALLAVLVAVLLLIAESQTSDLAERSTLQGFLSKYVPSGFDASQSSMSDYGKFITPNFNRVKQGNGPDALSYQNNAAERDPFTIVDDKNVLHAATEEKLLRLSSSEMHGSATPEVGNKFADRGTEHDATYSDSIGIFVIFFALLTFAVSLGVRLRRFLLQLSFVNASIGDGSNAMEPPAWHDNSFELRVQAPTVSMQEEDLQSETADVEDGADARCMRSSWNRKLRSHGWLQSTSVASRLLSVCYARTPGSSGFNSFEMDGTRKKIAMGGLPCQRSRRFSRREAYAASQAAVLEKPFPKIVTEKLHVPASDERQYRIMELENGLQVCLASDSTADTAAAALVVRCGSLQDTDELPGLAHFHEHMLFLGTEKYPAEDEYNKFLNEHGGFGNAYTTDEFTAYYFKVASSHLQGALDRFSQFFVAPNFDISCVEREMKAVDSESTNYSTEDSWRTLHIRKALADSSHPFHRFSVGNLSTLGVADALSTRTELIRWNQEHYQAGGMKLTVVGKESLDHLQETVVTCFSPVRGGPGVEQKYDSVPYPAQKLGRIVYTVTLKENRSLSVSWPIPPKTEYLFLKPERYLSHILGHEGKGSLRDALNQRGWVDRLSAGPAQSLSDSQLFKVSISLTPEGDESRDAVLDLLFDYVAMVRNAGPQQSVFQELAAMQEIAFAYKEETPAPDDFAVGAARALFYYPPEEAIRGPFAVDEWDPSVVKKYLDMLQPERSIVLISSPLLATEAGLCGSDDNLAEGWQREQWYNAPYREELIPPQRLEKWRGSGENRQSSLSLPLLNPFIPQDFALRGNNKALATRLPAEVAPPVLLSDGPVYRVWHKTDNTFSSPRVYVLAKAHTAAYELGPETVTMMRLFCNVVNDDLNSFAYDARIAGLSYSLKYSDSLSLTVGGFSDKLPKLLQVVVGRMKDVLLEAEASDNGDGDRKQELLERLEAQRELMLVGYKNFTRGEPWNVGKYFTSQIMMHKAWQLDEYVEILKRPPSLSAMAAAVRPALDALQMDVFVHGNASPEESQSLAGIVQDCFSTLASQQLVDVPRREVTMLPQGVGTVFEYDLASKNPAQENCSTQNVYQVGVSETDLHRFACLVVACHIGGPSAYDRLRTQEQLGYIVQASFWSEQYVSGLTVLVQGARMAPAAVDSRIEAWLGRFQQELEDMTEDDFETNVQAVINAETQRYSRMAQETTQHWVEIASRRRRFDRLSGIVHSLEALSKKDVLEFFNEYLAAGAVQRRKLSMQILGTSAAGVSPGAEVSGERVLRNLTDIREFKAACEVFPTPPESDLPSVVI